MKEEKATREIDQKLKEMGESWASLARMNGRHRTSFKRTINNKIKRLNENIGGVGLRVTVELLKCDVCGSENVIESHMGRNCNDCNPL